MPKMINIWVNIKKKESSLKKNDQKTIYCLKQN